MKIYVITKGEYSDYHICGVAVEKAKAESMARIFSDKWEKAEVEEWDTEDVDLSIEGKTPYRVTFFENGDVCETAETSIDYFMSGIEKIKYPQNWRGATLNVCVYADDKNSAIKIASEKRAKWLAEKLGL